MNSRKLARLIHVIVLGVLVLAVSGDPKSQTAHSSAKVDTRDSRHLSTVPAAAQAVAAEKARTDSAEHGESEFWPPVYGLRLKISDSLLVLFTFVLAIFTGLLWWSTNKLWKETKAASAISKQAADAAHRSADVTEKALTTNARAFVFPAKIHAVAGISQKAGGVVDWTFFVIWENTGSTPARGMYMHTNWHSYDNELPDDFDFPDLGNPAKRVPIRMGPKTTTWSAKCEVPIDILVAAAEKRKHIYLWGWVEYNDVFDDVTRHRSEVCIEIVVAGDPKVAQISSDPNYPNVPFHYNGGQKFGGFDDECFRKPMTTLPKK